MERRNRVGMKERGGKVGRLKDWDNKGIIPVRHIQSVWIFQYKICSQ
jgi:hypothetical protein